MKHDFLITSPHLNQAFDAGGSSGGGALSNEITRRAFIKRAGGATVATLVAWNLTVSRSRADQDYPYGGSGSFLMVCMTAPSLESRFFDSGKHWDYGVLSVSGLRAYFTAIGPMVGDSRSRGGTFQLSVNCHVQSWYGTSVESAACTADVNPTADQQVRFGGAGVEYDPPKISDPETYTVDAGWFPSNSDGTLEGNVEFDNGHLELVGDFSGISISDFTIGSGSYGLSLPTLPAAEAHFKGILVWSFSIMTRQEYIDYFGRAPH